ncbi:MAG: glycosyltransferase [Marinilabiliales bacterium]|nr:glycosyltransferase [Marinilabiliales bacterium]
MGDAIGSVLSQKTEYRFNLIIVDNYSTDGTTDVIRVVSQVTTGWCISYLRGRISGSEGAGTRPSAVRGAAGLPSSSTVMTCT